MTAAINANGHFSNQSLEGQEPRGNVGKLNPEQIKVRARKHALRFATGKPTIAEIAESWMTEYGISMTYWSEKEWASRNEDAIQGATVELVETGEIKVQPFTESSLLNTLKVSGNETGKVIRKIERSIVQLMEAVDIDFDPMKAVNLTHDEYFLANQDDRRVFDKKIQAEAEKNRLRIDAIKAYAIILRDQKGILLETVKVANDLYKSSEARHKQIEKQIGHTVSEILNEKDKSELEVDGEVTDADRERVLKNGRDTK